MHQTQLGTFHRKSPQVGAQSPDARPFRSGYGDVLSVSKLRVGAEAYQLTGVAQSLDDYYSGSGEAEGWWAGRGAEHLGLEGTVAGDDLRALLAGLAPGGSGLSPNGETIHPHPRRVPGFDLTFKAPKSVSVLYAVSDDPRVQGAIIDASEAALRDTLAWLERDVMATRRGTGNERFLADLAQRDPAAAEAARIRTESGGEIAAAVFRHRTSRAGDPLLHWHVLIPNLVRGGDERWSAFVHPHLFRNAKAAGEIYQAALRLELTERLGVQWRPGRHVPEIVGVPQAACDGFSKRSKEIEAWLDAQGRTADPASRQDAVLATRRGKAELEGEKLDARWKTEGVGYGFGPEQAEALICGPETTRSTPTEQEIWRLPEVSVDPDGTPYAHDRIVSPEEWIGDLLTNDLCVADATFTRPEMLQAVAHRLGDGASITTIEAIAARVMASAQVLSIDTSDDRQGIRRWTSIEMVAIERRLLDGFAERGNRAPVAPETIAATLAAHSGLGADQASAVSVLTSSTDPVSVMVGPAGTGKTYTLNVAREAFETAGLTVIGAAPSARAAAELEAGAGIESFTLHALNRRWSSGQGGPGPNTALIIDEAAMAATRDLEPLVTQTIRSGGRVVLVGDHRQLPEVTAGGGLAAAIDTVGSVAELTVNRRQHHDWERVALEELRNGSVPNAVDAYRAHGRVTIVAEDQSLVAVAADRYLAAIDDGLRPILMAGTNDTVRRLNSAVREQLILRGTVAPHGDRRADQTPLGFGVGDRVVLRRNQRIEQPDRTTIAVRNSDAAQIVAVEDDGAFTVRRDVDHAVIRLDATYVSAGHVDHGYAVTAHRAQGGTWDLAIAVGADGLYREAAYVQMSRGRASNELIIPAPQMADIDRELARHDRGLPLPGEEPPEALDDLIDRMEKSRAKVMALGRDPDADRIATLARSTSLPDLDRRAHQCRTAERAATRHIGIEPKVLTAAIERAQRTALHVQVGQQVKAYDRQNIGVVIGIDDSEGTVDVHFRSHSGHEAIRRLPWTEIDIVERTLPPARVLPAVAHEHLDRLVSACNETISEWRQKLEESGTARNEARRCERARDLVIDRSAALLAARTPEWLTELIGPRPAGPHDASIWDHAVRAIAEQRALTRMEDGEPGLGAEPGDPTERCQWQATSRHVLEARTHLANADSHRSLGPWPLLPSRSQLDERLAQLDEVLASAPPDQRDLLDRLRSGDQMTLLDTTEALNAALDTQGARRDWILANWPHVVEYAEITRAIDSRTYGPDLAGLHASIERSSESEPLLDAVANAEPWVDRALAKLVGRTATTVSSDARVMLEAIAQYRQHWGISSSNPIGPVPRDADQADHLATLVDRLERGWGAMDRRSGLRTESVDRAATAVEVPLDRAEDLADDVGVGLL